MPYKSVAIAAMLAASFVSLHAQEANGDQPPLYGGIGIHVDGVFVTPVAGAPFSATATVQNRQTLPDGSSATESTINLIGRDSLGRIHNERRRMFSESFHGSPPLLEVHLFDPQTRVSAFYDPATRIARQRVLPEPSRETSPAGPPNPQVKLEDLGTTTLDGLDARGTRRTFTVPARLSGTGAPVEVTDEYWYSEDLHINILMRRTDPRYGVQTVAVMDVKREEPAPAFFEVPPGYKTVDVTPPPGAPAVRGNSVAGGPTQ
jgi:hypothetical protein